MKKNTKTDKAKSKGMVVYTLCRSHRAVVKNIRKHGFLTGMKPHRPLRNMLVHPKDKRDPSQTAEAIYEIPCKNCPKSCVGETGRLFRTRLSEHKTETVKLSAKNYTRSQRRASTSEIFKSAITEHVATSNHVIGWDEAKIIDLEPEKTTRWLK